MQIRIGLAGLGLAALAACGGGGGDSPSVTLQTPSLALATVQHNAANGDLAIATHGFKQGDAIYFEVEGGRDLLSGVTSGGDFSDVAHLGVTLRDDLSPGTHTETIKLHACVDEQCKTEYRGSPMSLAVSAAVSPNIGVAPVTTLQRAGADPAPSIDVPVTVPAGAGTLYFSPETTVQGVTLTFADSVVHVATTQLRAGTYTATAHLSGSNPAYFADMSVQYTVDPPAGGEHGMSVDTQAINFSLNQGEVQTRQIVVTRPTWTSDYTPLALLAGCDSVYSLTDLGSDTYRLTASAINQPIGSNHDCSLFANAGDTGVVVGVRAQIGQAFGVAAPQPFTIDRSTQAASLQQAVAVTMTDGASATWTASATAPWLKLTRTSGTAGVDTLALSVDPTNLGAYLPGATALVHVSVDRANVPAQDIPVGLSFTGSWLNDAWAGTFGNGAGRVYVAGQFDYDITTSHAVSVSGARLVQAQTVTDGFFLGNVQVLQLDVDQVVDGQPITVAIGSPYLTTQATVPVAMGRSYGAGSAALPYALRKPPSFSAVNGALYFAGQDTVWRFAANGGTWGLTSASLPGVIDVDPRPDEAHVLAVSQDSVAMLDPVTLQATWSGAPVSDYFGSPAAIIGAADVDSKAILHTSDGNSWVTYATPSAANMASAGVGQLTLGLFDGTRPTGVHINQSRGQYAVTSPNGGPSAPWMIGSNDHQAVLATSAFANDATALLGESMKRLDVDMPFGSANIYGEPTFAWPVAPAAVSAGGFPALRVDGELWYSSFGSMHSADLRTLISAGQTAGGWSLTRDGYLVLLYTYQVAGTGDAATASLPTLHVFQMNSTTSQSPTVPPTEIATIAMASVPGCGSPRASGESCVHAAHLLVDPSASVVFVVGTRGVVAVPLPPSVTAVARINSARRSHAAAAHPALPAVRAVAR